MHYSSPPSVRMVVSILPLEVRVRVRMMMVAPRVVGVKVAVRVIAVVRFPRRMRRVLGTRGLRGAARREDEEERRQRAGHGRPLPPEPGPAFMRDLSAASSSSRVFAGRSV